MLHDNVIGSCTLSVPEVASELCESSYFPAPPHVKSIRSMPQADKFHMSNYLSKILNDVEQPPSPCYFLDKLPLELRFRVYEYLITYQTPIKVCPTKDIFDPVNLAILRANRQVHDEALQVLFESNRIVARPGDLCNYTPESMKTPLRWELIRHLFISHFGPSIHCASSMSSNGGHCDICGPSRLGLIRSLTTMPKLKTVVIDYQANAVEMHQFHEFLGKMDNNKDLELVADPKDPLRLKFRLKGPLIGKLNIEFRYGGRRSAQDIKFQRQSDLLKRLAPRHNTST